jgi:hypothetical protein
MAELTALLEAVRTKQHTKRHAPQHRRSETLMLLQSRKLRRYATWFRNRGKPRATRSEEAGRDRGGVPEGPVHGHQVSTCSNP